MSMNKIKNIPLETTATYQALSNLNVQFWNQDTQTAILQFQITRNNYPLALSEENVEVFIALESGDSFLVDKNLDFTDQLNGIVSYTIPNDFMRVAKDVVGQVYVTTLDGEETIVQRQFSFIVANDLIANLPAEDKIREIKYFSDMRAEVAQMMEKLNNDFENMNDYVSQVNQATEDGINALTKLIDDKQKAYNDNHTAKMKELNDKGAEYSNKFDSDKQYIDEKSQAFKDAVNGSGVVTTGQSKDWQKYKLTSDDGTRVYLKKGSFSNVTQLNPGLYETIVNGSPLTQGFPSTITNDAYVEIDITKAAANRTQIKVVQSSNTRTYVKYLHTDGVDNNDWKEVAFTDPNNPFETTQGATEKANTAESNAKTYIDGKISTLHNLLFSGSVNGVGKNIVINDDYNNYDEIRLFYSTLGGRDSKVVRAKETNQIVVYSFNLTNSDGGNGDIFETIIDRVNGTTLKISNEVRFNLLNQTGGSTSGITITEIVGVKY